MDLGALTGWMGHMPALTLVMARVGSLIVSSPLLGAAYVPASVKALLTIAISLVIVPRAAPQEIPLDLSFVLLLGREVFFGLSMGWMLSLYAEGVRMGGELINRHAGFSAAENFDPEANIGAGPMGDLLYFGLLLLFLATDGHLIMLASIARSFELVPLGAWAPAPGLEDLVGRGVSDAWSIALALSFPVLSAVMAITLVEGIMTRAIPQINVLHISFAVKIVVSMGVLYAGMPAVVAFMGTVLVAMQGMGVAFVGLQ